ncbi:hypothetical protein, conserved [Eimeria praecox]|uniref:Uncharacterized protein n=1 Tax=Eimeria praecox TaxID=51316 RepID=U6HB64_9EIME|nr:hypothetical protein, conserved [Eimeria praecox]
MALQDLYCLAYAPLQGTCLMDLEEDDYTQETLQKEMKFLQRFTSTSLEVFSKFFEKADLSSAEGAAALYCMTSFFNRLQVVSLRAGTLAGELMALNKVDYHDTIKSITSKVKAEGLQPEDSRLEDIVETDKEAEWDFPAAGKGKVEFRHSVSMVAPKDYGKDDAAEVSHQPVKAEFTRKKVRKATGYAKFNFTADDLQEPANKSDDDTEEKSVGSDSSASKTPSSAASETRHSTTKKMDDGPFSYFCCFCPSGGAGTNENEVVRRGSSVSLGTVQEIQDKDADANWHDSERHSGRYARIRGRIPTGHASLMKSSSDDMLDVLLAEDSEEGRRARELLLHNTELNSCSPPLSVRSCSSEAFGPSDASDCSKGSNGFSGRDANSDANHRASVRDENDAGSKSASSGNALSIIECHLNPSI